MSDSSKIDWAAVYERLRLSEQKLAEVLAPNPERIQSIQEERAARLASRRRSGDAEATVPMLIVEMAGEKIAIEIAAVSEVLPIASVTPVAGAPDGVVGVVNLRGELYSVLDSRSFLKTERTGGEVTWGVALRHSTLHIMLGVDVVLRIDQIPCSALDTLEANVLRLRDEIAIVLDTRGILERLEAGLASSSFSHDQP